LADIFHEVDEEVRRERLQKLWERYNVLIIAVAVLIVAGIGAWRGYEWWISKQAAAAGAKFEAALALSDAGKHAEAQAAFAKLAADGAPSGYRTLARFRAATELAQTKPAEAAKAYDAIASDPSVSSTLQDLATLRAAMLRVDDTSFKDLQLKLAPLAEQGRPFRHTAREMLALSAWQHHDTTAAKKYIGEITGDPTAPPLMRIRAETLSRLIAAQGTQSKS